MLGRFVLILLALGLMPASANAEHYYVRNQNEYAHALSQISAGDIIIMADGEWRDFEIVITGRGTQDNPITLISESPGGVILTGQSNLRIGGNYILVTGLVFRDGYSPTGEVISFRRDSNDLARNSRVSEVVIDNFSKPDRNETDYWVAMFGSNNRVDHSHFEGKTNRGVTFAVRLDARESRNNNHRIDHNYFGPRPVLGSNGGETLRIGTSRYSMHDSNTVVENNVFDRTDGEVEIISSKSGGNVFRGNLFLNSRGALTLRHGDGNVVERNVFLGNGKDHTGGIRVINRDQTIRGNYMEGLRGTGFSSALTVMNGVPNSPVNRYVQVEGAQIQNNSVIDVSRITLGAGADEERSAVPTDSVMQDNLFMGMEGRDPFRVDADISGIAMQRNVVTGSGQSDSLPRLIARDVTFERAANGLLYPSDPSLADIGAPRDLQVMSLEEVGVSWYPKPDDEGPFGSGQIIDVAAGGSHLVQALASAEDGDTLLLAAGDYVVERALVLDKSLTIAGTVDAEGSRSTLRFTRPSLIELRDGADLRLESLTIDGDLAPDSVGNSVIRTGSMPIYGNLVIEMQSVHVRGLVVNRDFNVLTFGYSTLADRVDIRDSVFEDISGTIIGASAESDDQGRYNVEYLDIANSIFSNVGGSLAYVYRGGRDESTFGPHVSILRNVLNNVGDRSGQSIRLHGVQSTEIADNVFNASSAIGVIHTVGTPVTSIRRNVFNATPAPDLTELIFPGEPRVEMTNNHYATQAAE